MAEFYSFNICGKSDDTLKQIFQFLNDHNHFHIKGYHLDTTDHNMGTRQTPLSLIMYNILSPYEINKGAVALNNQKESICDIILDYIHSRTIDDLKQFGTAVDATKPYEIGWRIRSDYDYCIGFVVEPYLFTAETMMLPRSTLLYRFKGDNETLADDVFTFLLNRQDVPKSFCEKCIDKSFLENHEPPALLIHTAPAWAVKPAVEYAFDPTPIVLKEQLKLYLKNLTEEDIEAFDADEKGYEENYYLGWSISNDYLPFSDTIVVRPAHIEYGK